MRTVTFSAYEIRYTICPYCMGQINNRESNTEINPGKVTTCPRCQRKFKIALKGNKNFVINEEQKK
jgi:NAD-dependent SIR2 family protein deacetylase